MEEKGLFFYCFCVFSGVDFVESFKGIMKLMMKFWGFKVVNMFFYVLKLFYCGFVYLREFSLLFFRNTCC